MTKKNTFLAVMILISILFTRCDISERIRNNKKASTAIRLSGLSPLLKNNDPITTCFADTRPDDSLPLTFGDSLKAKPLNEQPKSNGNGYILSPGFYEMVSRSYCLQPGTYGPSEGDGYLYAPLLGDKKEIIMSIVKNSEKYQHIPQSTVQLLIWAVLARTNFENLSPELKAASVVLLSPEQLFELNGGALGLLPASTLEMAAQNITEAARPMIGLHNSMRQLYQNANTTYQEFEALAVLPGENPNSIIYPSGVWSKHPKGYYVRYFPLAYHTTRVQVYVPDNINASADIITDSATFHLQLTVEYDGCDMVAVPAQTCSQRLLQSNVAKDHDSAVDLIRYQVGQLTPLQQRIWDEEVITKFPHLLKYRLRPE